MKHLALLDKHRLTIIFFLACILQAHTEPGYVLLINSGRLTEAKDSIHKAIEDNVTSVLDKAIAYKHLGTVLFRLGDNYLPAFEQSDQMFQQVCAKQDSAKAQEEYSLMLYQKANCLLSSCEAELSKSKLQGVPVVPFQYVKKYVSPAERNIAKAKEHYPADKIGDISLISMELFLTEFHIWLVAGQIEMAAKASEKAMSLAVESLSTKLPLDAKSKLIIRYATLLAETGSIDKNPDRLDKAIELLEGTQKENSGNVELDAALTALWAKLTLASGKGREAIENVEKRIVEATDNLEKLRAMNVSAMDFVARKEYFASRTGLYEILVELYAKQNAPFKMLNAINRMRSRSIQDFAKTEQEQKTLTEDELKKLLKDGKGMLLAYFMAADTVWMVTFDAEGGEISHTRLSGQEIAYLSSQILSIFSNPQHAQAYFRYGPSYSPVTNAYKAANMLYIELLQKAHQKFLRGRYDHVYVIPHNILNYLPLSVLVINVNESNAFQSQFVADIGLPVTYLPSLSAIQSSNVSYNGCGTMVLARGTYSYPAYYNACPENPDNESAPVLNLPNVPDEGRQVAQMLRTPANRIYFEKEASEQNLMKITSDQKMSVVHIASHAHLNHDSPMDSYVVLAASDGEDGKVKVRELLDRYRGKMKVGLLVLSACDTNKGESNIQPGDDIAALSNAFIVAGSENVIATQWPASDTSFPKIMELFYSHLQQGASPDIALALAQRQFLSGGQMAMRYPIFWANIVLCGKNQKK